MASNPDTARSAIGFINSIGINVHMGYTDGAYASEPNVASDLAYLGIKYIRDGLPTKTGSIPVQNQITALNELAAQGVKFDLVTSNTGVQADITALNSLEQSSPGAIFAVEGPNEINNWPVTYQGLSGEAAAVAFQKAYYAAVMSDSALTGVSVYDFTGGTAPVLTPYGTLTQNSDGSFTLVKGITGWLASLPVGVTTVTITYTGAAPTAGLFHSPGNGQESSLTTGSNGTLTFTYDNTGTKALQTYISVSDWGGTTVITGVTAVSGGSGNLVTFDPDMSLAGMAADSNTHPYPAGGAEPGSYITSSKGLPVPGPRVITEDGYNTDPKDANGVSQTVQAQDEVKILLDAYNAGVSQTYLYELLDEKPDPSDSNAQMHYGVFNNDNTPKPAAVAIHDLTTILNEGNAAVAGFKPGSLAWSATGLPTTASTMLLEQTDGAFDLAIWNEPASASAGPASVTVALGATYGDVEVFDPITGSTPVATLTDVSQVTLTLGEDPLIIEVEPGALLNAAARMRFLAAGAAREVAAARQAGSAGLLSGRSAAENFAGPMPALAPIASHQETLAGPQGGGLAGMALGVIAKEPVLAIGPIRAVHAAGHFASG